jgi:hypothetical protein
LAQLISSELKQYMFNIYSKPKAPLQMIDIDAIQWSFYVMILQMASVDLMVLLCAYESRRRSVAVTNQI